MNWDDFVRRRNLNVPVWYKNSGFKDYDEFHRHLSSQGMGGIPTQKEINALLETEETVSVVKPLKKVATKKKNTKKQDKKKQDKRKKEKGRKKNDEHETEPIIDSLYGE